MEGLPQRFLGGFCWTHHGATVRACTGLALTSSVQNEEADRIHYKCVRELFAVTGPRGEFVSIEKFGRVLGFLPELKRGREWFANLENLCRQPWFWADTSSRDAYRALVPAPSRSFMVRFSGQAPWFTVSFKDKGGNVLHRCVGLLFVFLLFFCFSLCVCRRIMRSYGAEEVRFENSDLHPRASETFPSLPHLISAFQPLMRWKPLQGGPTWWIFHEQDDKGDARALGGYGGYFRGFVVVFFFCSLADLRSRQPLSLLAKARIPKTMRLTMKRRRTR